jgi:ankyrin repeat protein
LKILTRFSTKDRDSHVYFYESKNMSDAQSAGSKLTHHPAAELKSLQEEKIKKDVDKLTTAAFFGEIDLVKDLLEKGIEPDSRDSRGGTPLCRTCAGNYDFSVDFAQTIDPENPLDSERHRQLIDLFLDLGAEINALTPQYKSPLMYAAFRGYPKTVLKLLEAGANVHQKSFRGIPGKSRVERLPLLDAIVSGNQATIDLILEAGANPQDLKFFNMTDLSIATCLGREDIVIEILSTLSSDQRRVEIETRDRFGATPLIWASVTGRVEIAKLLLNAGAKVDAKDAKGRTSLIRAVPRGHFEIAKILVENGADVNMRSKNNSTPLLWAACRGRYDSMVLLIENGAEVNMANNSEASPLYRSVAIGHTEGVKLLLDHGAAETIQRKIGRSPILCARGGLGRKESTGFKDILSLLKSAAENE